MDYEKKRMRQNGRQKRKGITKEYFIWLGKDGEVFSSERRDLWKGHLDVPFKSMTQEEFRRDYENI